MRARNLSQPLSVFCINFTCLVLTVNCSKSARPSPRPVPTAAASASTEKTDKTAATNKDKDNAGQDSNKKKADSKGEDPSKTPEVAQALPEAKQAEIKSLLAGNWASGCIKAEDPANAGQFFYFSETWKVAADGTVEITSSDFDDAACKTPTKGFESYVVLIFKSVGLKELGSMHFYLEMNISKEFKEDKLVDVTDKGLMMVKFEASGMSVDYPKDMTATTLSADATKFTKK